MKIKINLSRGTKIYTIEDCKIEEYFIEDIYIKSDESSIMDFNFSNRIILKLEKYNDGINSFKTEKKLLHCFLNKEDLIKQL